MIQDSDSSSALSAFEAERLVQNLQKLSLKDYGSNAWLKQHESIQKLNIQAHLNAQSNNEEFVTEALLTFEKMEVLVHELLVAETWKLQVEPFLLDDMRACWRDASLALIPTATQNYHEAAIGNLLEIVLFNKQALLACQDSLLDLVDYCARKMTLLNAWEHNDPEPKSAQEMLNMTEKDRYFESKKELDFGIAMSALSTMRYITDQITDVSLSVMSRILFFHEVACSCVYLIEKAPWMRRSGSKKQLVRYENGVWREIPMEDLPRLCKIEAQVWLILYNILLEPECRKKYDFNEYNKSLIIRLKAYMPSTLLDQVPVLENLKRYLEELTIMQVPDNPALVRRGTGVEQIPEVLQSIKGNIDFKQLAQQQKSQLFNETPEMKKEIAKSLMNMYNFDDMDTLLEEPKCSQCGTMATQRCSRCKNEWYCGRKCQVKGWKSHKTICDILSRKEIAEIK